MTTVFSKPKSEPIHDPEPPVEIGKGGEGDTRRVSKEGRGGTILAGELTPKRKKRVLG